MRRRPSSTERTSAQKAGLRPRLVGVYRRPGPGHKRRPNLRAFPRRGRGDDDRRVRAWAGRKRHDNDGPPHTVQSVGRYHNGRPGLSDFTAFRRVEMNPPEQPHPSRPSPSVASSPSALSRATTRSRWRPSSSAISSVSWRSLISTAATSPMSQAGDLMPDTVRKGEAESNRDGHLAAESLNTYVHLGDQRGIQAVA
jgi:hypothetical protein